MNVHPQSCGHAPARGHNVDDFEAAWAEVMDEPAPPVRDTPQSRNASPPYAEMGAFDDSYGNFQDPWSPPIDPARTDLFSAQTLGRNTPPSVADQIAALRPACQVPWLGPAVDRMWPDEQERAIATFRLTAGLFDRYGAKPCWKESIGPADEPTRFQRLCGGDEGYVLAEMLPRIGAGSFSRAKAVRPAGHDHPWVAKVFRLHARPAGKPMARPHLSRPLHVLRAAQIETELAHLKRLHPELMVYVCTNGKVYAVWDGLGTATLDTLAHTLRDHSPQIRADLAAATATRLADALWKATDGGRFTTYDLKGANVVARLVAGELVIENIDFGLMREGPTGIDAAYTSWWRPPEIFEARAVPSKALAPRLFDTWAWAITVLDVFAGSHIMKPIQATIQEIEDNRLVGKNGMSVLRILQSRIQPCIDELEPHQPRLAELLRRATSAPAHRPSLEELRQALAAECLLEPDKERAIEGSLAAHLRTLQDDAGHQQALIDAASAFETD